MDTRDVRYRELIDQIRDGVYIVDRSRRILDWNRGAEEISGFDRELVVGSHCFDNILRHMDSAGEPLCHRACPLQRTMEDGRSRESLIYLHHRQGHRIPVQVKTSPLRDQQGEIIGAVEVFNDATPDVLASQIDELKQAAMTDSLTGLPNRRYLEMSLSARLHEWRHVGRDVGVLILDIDHFKAVNDQHGHDVGDQVLVTVANTLRHGARAQDEIGRWGGEEFLVVARCGATALREIAERFRVLVAASHLRDRDPELGVTVSIGGALASGDDSVETLFRRADEELYRAKSKGRDRVEIESSD